MGEGRGCGKRAGEEGVGVEGEGHVEKGLGKEGVGRGEGGGGG